MGWSFCRHQPECNLVRASKASFRTRKRQKKPIKSLLKSVVSAVSASHLACRFEVKAPIDYDDIDSAAFRYSETLTAAYCHSGLANCLLRQGNIKRAMTLYRETLPVYHQFDEPRCVAWTLYNLAFATKELDGDPAQVKNLLAESLAYFGRVPPSRSGAACVEAALAGTWALPREPIRL